MTLETIASAFYDYYLSTTLGLIELLASVFLIINVYLLVKQKLVNYYFGFIGVALMGYVLFSYNLYSDMLLQWVFYGPLQIIGYYVWRDNHQSVGSFLTRVFRAPIRAMGYYVPDVAPRGDERDALNVIRMSNLARTYCLGAIIGTAIVWGWLMQTYTDADYAYLDALTTAMSVVASVLMLRKFIENWVIWISMDLIAIPLYYSKGAYVITALYVVFLGLACTGLYQWWRSEQQVKNGTVDMEPYMHEVM